MVRPRHHAIPVLWVCTFVPTKGSRFSAHSQRRLSGFSRSLGSVLVVGHTADASRAGPGSGRVSSDVEPSSDRHDGRMRLGGCRPGLSARWRLSRPSPPSPRRLGPRPTERAALLPVGQTGDRPLSDWGPSASPWAWPSAAGSAQGAAEAVRREIPCLPLSQKSSSFRLKIRICVCNRSFQRRTFF